MFPKAKHFQVRFLTLTTLVVVFLLTLVVWTIAYEAEVQNQLEPAVLPVFPTPQPQFFCGSCHILTHPEIIQKGYDLWKKSKHKDVGCVQCHYPPNKSEGLGQAVAASLVQAASHVPKGPPKRFSYIQMGGQIVQTRAHIVDASCMTADCHSKPGDTFKTKKIKFTEKVSFIHQPHFEEKNQIEGQKLNCTNCHQHETEQKKFEVSKSSCYLCHFMGSKLNEGRGRCELCHQLPEEPIRASGQEDSEDSEEKTSKQKPITHAMLKKANVSCASCHFELVQARSGATYEAFFDEEGVLKTALVYGAGRIKEENCLACHDRSEDVKKALKMKLMHERHVTVKNARCFDCHRTITHTKANLKDRAPQDDDPVVLNGCTTCHPESHFYQRALTSGMRNPADEPAPDPMYQARANCLACHVERTTLPSGQKVLKASDKTCIICHDKEYSKTFKDWKVELTGKIKTAHKVEQETLKALSKAKKKLVATQSDELEEILDEAEEILDEAQQNLKMVQFGNGVHNKKYSIMLIEEAITGFNDLKEQLEEFIQE
jgi:nitrate/TMAO reductase-like tetraheme cytochrome c subunit